MVSHLIQKNLLTDNTMNVDHSQALKLLKEGEVVTVPTETVYGLAGRIDSDKAIKKIFEIKKRPSFDPLIVHCYDSEMAKQFIDKNFLTQHETILDLLWKNFSPGPFTIVVPKNEKVSSAITSDQSTVALRIPQHPLTRKLIQELGVPLAAPSANIYSQLSPTKAEDVLEIFSNQVPVLDGGNCEMGLESSIVQIDFDNKKVFILRPGAIISKDLKNVLEDFEVVEKKESRQPGGQKKHYQPKVPLWIVETQKQESEVIGFLKQKNSTKNIKALNLDHSPQLAARHLYSQLRDLSQDGNNLIFVIRNKSHNTEHWQVIWNRLEKASSQIINYE